MSLRHALLGLVAIRPRSGYDLAKLMAESGPGKVWTASHSSIYPELQRMTEDGLLERSERGQRQRATYTLTEAGTAELRRWIRSDPGPRVVRDEMMLRVFNLWLLPPEEASTLLARMAEDHRARLADYQERATWPDIDEPGWYSGLALQAGISYERSMAEWAEWAAAKVAAHGKSLSKRSKRRSSPAATSAVAASAATADADN